MSKEYEVKVTSQAQKQLADIADYISTVLEAPEASDQFLSQVEQKIGSLKNFPEKYQLIEDEPWRSQGVRKLIVGNYLVYYWINNDNDTVYVIAVIYAGRDQDFQLKQIIILD